MVNTLTNHMATFLNPMLRTTNESYQQMNGILARIEDVWHSLPRYTYLYNKIHGNAKLHKINFMF